MLLTLDPENYPIGLKDTIISGDLPVVWTNTRYRMIYMNMGHGDKIFTNSRQNKLFENAILWLGGSQIAVACTWFELLAAIRPRLAWSMNHSSN